MSERYSKLFVNGDLLHADLLALVARTCSGTIDGWSVDSSCYELDVRPNENFSTRAARENPGDFLYFPYTVEISAAEGQCDEADYVRFVGTLMKSLHDAGMQVVAACDWEDDLPGAGGLGV